MLHKILWISYVTAFHRYICYITIVFKVAEDSFVAENRLYDNSPTIAILQYLSADFRYFVVDYFIVNEGRDYPPLVIKTE